MKGFITEKELGQAEQEFERMVRGFTTRLSEP